MKNFIILFLAASSFSVTAQWTDIPLSEFRDIILKIDEQTLKNKSYSYHADIFVFGQHNSTDTLNSTSSELVFNAKKKLINFNQLDNLVIQDENHQVICDTANKLIMLLDANPALTNQKQFVDFDALLKSECTTQKMNNVNRQGYKIVFAQGSQYHSLELWIDKSLNVEKIIIYAGVDVIDDSDWYNIKTLRPRMEIYLSNYEFDKAVEKKKILPISSVIIDIDKKILAEQYKDFELIDMRTFQVD